MKGVQIFLVSFLVLFITSISSETVYDFNGLPVRAGSLYSIVPAIPSPTGGGVTVLPPMPGQTCPTNVGQEPSASSNGRPLVFRQVTPNSDGNIHTSSLLSMQFGYSMVCGYSPIVQVGDVLQPIRTRILQNNGRQGNPSCQTAGNWFKFEKRPNTTPNMYEIWWDPTSLGSCGSPTPPTKVAVDSFQNAGNLLLGLSTGTSPPFYVRFRPFQAVGDTQLPTLDVSE